MLLSAELQLDTEKLQNVAQTMTDAAKGAVPEDVSQQIGLFQSYLNQLPEKALGLGIRIVLALITLFVYAGLLHAPILLPQRWLSGNKRQVAYHICAIVAFCFVLFTYFGVNHLLGGLHSYA